MKYLINTSLSLILGLAAMSPAYAITISNPNHHGIYYEVLPCCDSPVQKSRNLVKAHLMKGHTVKITPGDPSMDQVRVYVFQLINGREYGLSDFDVVRSWNHCVAHVGSDPTIVHFSRACYY